MNNIINQLEKNEYSVDDYNKLINLCTKKIEYIKKTTMNKQYLLNIKKIDIKNNELKYFFNIIYDSININSNEYFKSIIISFDYNDYSIDLCIYNDDDEYCFMDEKIHILNKKTHSYEVYYENCDKILFKILDFKSVNIKELNEFIKLLFEYAAEIISI